jgi:hypothetical protein
MDMTECLRKLFIMTYLRRMCVPSLATCMVGERLVFKAEFLFK